MIADELEGVSWAVDLSTRKSYAALTFTRHTNY